MSIATDVRAYADLALEQGKNVLSQAGTAVSTANKRLAADAPKPVLAAIGVADLVAATVTRQAELLGKRVETLPVDAAENVARVQDTGRSLINKTQDDALARITELRSRLDTGVDSVRALPMLSVTAASTTTVYLSNAKHVFGQLAARGEARLTELRNDPRVTRVLGDLDEASSTIQARLAPVLGSVRSEVVPYLDSAVDAIKDADLDEHAGRSTTTRRRAAGTRAASGARSSATRTRRSAKPATDSTVSTVDTGARKAAAKTSSTTRTAAAKTGSATRTAAAKTGSATRTAAAKTGSTTRTAAAKTGSATRTAAAKATSGPRKAAAKTTAGPRKAATRTTAQARKASAAKS